MIVEEIIKKTISNFGMLKRKDSLLLGVSGGPDSMFMLHYFSRIKEEYKLNLVCAHFNHCLRKEADREEDFVRNACRGLKIKFISEKKEVNKFFNGDSLEQTARNLRYDFFLKVCRQTKIKKLALAHHKDDLIETILMRLIRGSGLRGLRGFLPKSKFKGLEVIRPFISLKKDDIVSWLNREKISYCTDESNFQDKFFRNKIRIKLLPILKDLNPNIVDNLYNLALNLSSDYDFIHKEALGNFQSLRRGETKKAIKLDLAGLGKLHPCLLNNVIRLAMEELKGNLRGIEFRHLEEIKDLIIKRPAQSLVHLPSFVVRKEEKLLIIQTLIL